MKYYIWGNNNYNQVHVEIEPKLAKAVDTTNDSLSVVLKANNKAEPYKPMTDFKVKYDDNKEETFWIINDTVDVFSVKPLRYKHTLSIVQYRYFLNKHLIRNTVFNQPRKNKLELYGAQSCMCRVELGGDYEDYITWIHLVTNNTTKDPNFWGEKLSLNYHTKIKTLSYRLKMFGGTMAGSYPGYTVPSEWQELSSIDSTYNITFNTNSYFAIVDVNNSDYQLLKFRFSNNAINKDITISDTDIQTINNYIANHTNAVLRVVFWADNAGSPNYSETAFSFIQAIESHIPHYADGNGNENPDIYTKERYRYITAQVTFNLEIYNYTMYDVIETLLNQNVLRSSTQGWKIDTLFWMPESSSELYTLLKTTYPPDTLTFTQCTFYDALTEIFRFYDAGFKFIYKNDRHYLDIEYYNNPVDEVEPVLVGKQTSHSEKNYNNGRVAYYQNALLPIKIQKTTVRSQNLGVPGQNDFGILFEKPIYNIGKVYTVISDSNYFPPLGSNTNTYGYDFSATKIDITPFIVNEQEYTVLNKADPDGFSSGDDLSIRYQINTLHFSRGGNFINLSETYTDQHSQTIYKINNLMAVAAARYFGYQIQLESAQPQRFSYPAAGSWDEYVFTVEYQTMNNGRATVETATYKYKGNQIANQNAGLIDLNKLGLNILGEALKDGEPVLTASCTITDWNSRIKEGDYFIDDNGDYWVANVVNYIEFTNGKYRCSVEFSKNFNALALRVNSDKEKRLTNVSSENAVLSEDNFIDYVYANFDENRNDYSSDNDIVLNNGVLANMLCQTFKDFSKANVTYCDIQFALVDSYNINGSYNTYGNPSKQAKNLYIPVLKYGAGNCVCFEMQFNSPLSAGNMLEKTNGWFGTNKWFSSAALYTDDEGWADRISVKFCDLTKSGENHSIGYFPVVSDLAFTFGYITTVATISSLYYYKKPNEIFALNYEWCFLTAEPVKNDLFIGSKFINENFFSNKDSIPPKKFYLRYVLDDDAEEEQRYSVLDTKGFGQNVLAITGLNINVDNNKVRIGFKLDTSSYGISAIRWAVVDENNDIYFASNHESSFSFTSGVYQLVFFLRKQRIKDF